jgi:hypothetical protein
MRFLGGSGGIKKKDSTTDKARMPLCSDTDQRGFLCVANLVDQWLQMTASPSKDGISEWLS